MPSRTNMLRPLILLAATWTALNLHGPVVTSAQVSSHPELPSQPSSDPPTVVRETWNAIYLASSKVGFRHVVERRSFHKGDECREIKALESMQLHRQGQPTTIQLRSTSRELADGTVVSFGYEQRAEATGKPQSSDGVRGTVTDGQITWHKIGSSPSGDPRASSHKSDWPAGAGGFFAVEQSLRHQPLEPGQTRSITSLMPLLNSFVTTNLSARRNEDTDLLDGERQLLRIDAVAELPGGVKSRSVIWCDSRGTVFKNEQPSMKMVIYRTDRETALQSDSQPADLFREFLVKVDSPPQNPHRCRRLVYDVELNEVQPAETFATDERQQWRRLSDHRARLTTTATWSEVSEQSGSDQPKFRGPSEARDVRLPQESLQASELIQSDHPLIRNLATSVAKTDSDPWRVACALERLVQSSITEKNFASALASAVEVAQSRQGDCTEHAVLLAALCRARNIPARVAIGLVYVERSGGFLYHMWNEVWIKGHWRPLDATFGRGGIGAAHLKITDSLLAENAGNNVYASILPVLDILGQVRISVVAKP